jgi:L-Ala-D/L-Glu epimerase
LSSSSASFFHWSSTCLFPSACIAPALLVAQKADVVDLDGPLHLVSDRVPRLHYDGSTILAI